MLRLVKDWLERSVPPPQSYRTSFKWPRFELTGLRPYVRYALSGQLGGN
jgi:hypothetical protein